MQAKLWLASSSHGGDFPVTKAVHACWGYLDLSISCTIRIIEVLELSHSQDCTL